MDSLTPERCMLISCGLLGLSVLILLYRSMYSENFEYSLQDYENAKEKNPGSGLQIQRMQMSNGIIGLTADRNLKTAVDLDYIGKKPYDGQFSQLSDYLGQYYQKPYLNNGNY
jgi:hypothetical protein